MSNIEQLSVKQLIEKQGLTVHQLRTTLARLENAPSSYRRSHLQQGISCCLRQFVCSQS